MNIRCCEGCERLRQENYMLRRQLDAFINRDIDLEMKRVNTNIVLSFDDTPEWIKEKLREKWERVDE